MEGISLEIMAIIGLFLYRHLNQFKGYLESLEVPMIQENIFRVHKLVFPKFDQLCLKKYGLVWSKYEGIAPHIFIADPEILKEVMIKRFDCFTDRQHFPLGEKLCSLITSRSDAWHGMRKAITPMFTTAKIKPMIKSMGLVADELVENVDAILEKQTSVNMKPLLQFMSLDTILNCAFGIQGQSFKLPESELYKRCCRLFSDFRLRSFGESIAFYLCSRFPAILRIIDFIGMNNFRFLSNFTKDIAHSRKTKRGDFIDRLNDLQESSLAGKCELSEDQIFAQGIGIIQAAFETTSNTMGSLLYILAKNPHIQDQLIEEIHEVLGEIQPNQEITHEDLSQLSYMDAVIYENLRINPPVARLDRTCIKDCKIQGISFRKGTVIQIPVYAIHHHEEFYPEPQSFKPERFLGLSNPPKNDLTFLGFGAGPRYCVGIKFAMAEIKTNLIKLLSKYAIKGSDDTRLDLASGDLFFLVYPDLTVNLEPRAIVN